MKQKSKRGGKREGAGRPRKYGEEKAEPYHRYIPKSWFIYMDNLLEELTNKKS